MIKSESNNLTESPQGRMSSPEPLLTVDDLALFFRVKPSTVRKWAREGRIPQAIKCGNGWRFHHSVFNEHLPVEPKSETL
jgi:excisionase family DNA binding protein